MGQSAQQSVGAGGEQFYVTHCTTADSVLNNPGYAVRAASALDADVLDAALHYPPYELPIDMWRDLPPVEAAPRRLARTEDASPRAAEIAPQVRRGTRGKPGVWVVHSCYVAKDTVDRDRSYFSHLLLFPAAEPADVLRSWGAPGWATSYPQGESKKLNGNVRLPVGSLVSDAALTAFLGEAPSGPTELSITVCPSRLRADAAARRELFSRFLHAMLVFASQENPSRRRLYVHAEPGLTALLLYGAVRLLPSEVTDGLTFSTFEPYHRNIRDYKRAEVVGTYLGTPDRGLDPDLGTTRGVALDTFCPARSSPELRASLPAGVNDLVELAARGEWNLLPSVRHAVGANPAGLVKAGKALLRARGLARADAGEATIDDLLALQGDKLGAEELKLRAESVWPVVKVAALDSRRDDVRSAFRELIARSEHVEELWGEGFDALLKEDFRNWDSRWTAIRAAVGNDEARRLLNRVVGSEKNENRLSRLPLGVRARLRAACADVALMPPRPLLVPIGLGELEPLLSAAPEQAGYTAFVLMAKDALGWLAHIPPSNRGPMRERARAFLLDAPAEALAVYAQAALPLLDTDPALLDALFTPYSPAAAEAMDRLLSSGALEPDEWMRLCAAVGLTQNEWGDYLLEKDRLASFLVGLGGDGEGKDMWGAYLGLLTAALISPELIEVEAGDDPRVIHDWERKVHVQLRAAAERLTKAGVKLAPALPEGGVSRLFAANNLLKWGNDPASAERDGCEEVRRACDLYDVDPLDLARVAFKNGGFHRCDPGTEPKALAPFVALFRACFPVEADSHTASRAAEAAVRLSRDCPEGRRGSLQALLLHACIPALHYQALLNAEWRDPLHPYAVARLKEWVSGARKRAKNASPAAPEAEEAAAVVEEPISDEEIDESPEPEPVIQKKAGGKRWAWLALAAVAVLAGVVIVFVVKTLGG